MIMIYDQTLLCKQNRGKTNSLWKSRTRSSQSHPPKQLLCLGYRSFPCDAVNFTVALHRQRHLPVNSSVLFVFADCSNYTTLILMPVGFGHRHTCLTGPAVYLFRTASCFFLLQRSEKPQNIRSLDLRGICSDLTHQQSPRKEALDVQTSVIFTPQLQYSKSP